MEDSIPHVKFYRIGRNFPWASSAYVPACLPLVIGQLYVLVVLVARLTPSNAPKDLLVDLES